MSERLFRPPSKHQSNRQLRRRHIETIEHALIDTSITPTDRGRHLTALCDPQTRTAKGNSSCVRNVRNAGRGEVSVAFLEGSEPSIGEKWLISWRVGTEMRLGL
jgi:hypothetical protein